MLFNVFLWFLCSNFSLLFLFFSSSFYSFSPFLHFFFFSNQLENRDSLITALNNNLSQLKSDYEKQDRNIHELNNKLNQLEEEKNRILHANGALQDTLAFAETKIVS